MEVSGSKTRVAPDAAAPRDEGGRTRLVVSAPAKVNLFLHVTGRRADGYHTLESLFALIDWADTIALDVRADGAIVRANAVPGVPEDDDLSIRAARTLKARAGTRLGVTIDVEKSLPMGAGLGGGSSDAASVLLALNRLWLLHLPRSELAAIAGTLGADVPFFVGGMAAVARGTGDVLAPVSMPTLWLVLALPRTHVSTAAIFAAPDLTRTTPSAKIDVFSEGYGHNDLEPIAAAQFVEVARAIAALKRASVSARMTGSGSCAFAAFASEAAAQEAQGRMPRGLATRIVRTLPWHPLVTFA